MNNQTTTEALEKKIDLLLLNFELEHHTSGVYPHRKALDEIMQLLAQEKTALLEKTRRLNIDCLCGRTYHIASRGTTLSWSSDVEEDREGKDK